MFKCRPAFSILSSYALALIAVFALPKEVPAQTPLQLTAGTLNCQGGGSVGFIFGSTETLSCIFTPANNAPKQAYTARITKYGIDLGFKSQSSIVWTVLGSNQSLPEGELAGQYGGVSADVAVGLGVGANALVGGSDKSIVLQPLSVESQIGLNIAVGITGLTLIYENS